MEQITEGEGVCVPAWPSGRAEKVAFPSDLESQAESLLLLPRAPFLSHPPPPRIWGLVRRAAGDEAVVNVVNFPFNQAILNDK